ncbi:MAG TPA: peptide deformylase [Saprospiraceae bacterium]|nr:peptide deformylase [Saprospiraceae bacterium]
MALSEIRLLGDPILYERCAPVKVEEVKGLMDTVDQMARLVLEFRGKYGAGRAIAAPQVGVLKRLVVLNIDQPVAIFNPELFAHSEETMELWDDCMSFPNLLVRLRRHQSVKLRFRDENWAEQVWTLEGDLSELLQHEVDHLDGILATTRAIDGASFQWRVT